MTEADRTRISNIRQFRYEDPDVAFLLRLVEDLASGPQAPPAGAESFQPGIDPARVVVAHMTVRDER